ncbi:hypothetical protein Q3A68_00660 [Mucilaginibacter sp. BT774]|nr:hypothetical protein [Mucilaginibacter sp. BT774]
MHHSSLNGYQAQGFNEWHLSLQEGVRPRHSKHGGQRPLQHA